MLLLVSKKYAFELIHSLNFGNFWSRPHFYSFCVFVILTTSVHINQKAFKEECKKKIKIIVFIRCRARTRSFCILQIDSNTCPNDICTIVPKKVLNFKPIDVSFLKYFWGLSLFGKAVFSPFQYILNDFFSPEKVTFLRTVLKKWALSLRSPSLPDIFQIW